MGLVPVQDVYDAFLVLIESDEWDTWEEDAANQDLGAILRAALPWFKFPRCSLGMDENQEYFVDTNIGNQEIQVLAHFMKFIWYGRVVDSWENVRPFYTERDFSPGKMLGEFKGRHDSQLKNAEKLESLYYRSIQGVPFDYRKLAGGK